MASADIAASARFRPGSRVGSYRVVRFDGKVLELRGHPGLSMLFIVGGLLLAAWGVFPWLTLIRDGSARLRWLIMLPMGLLLAVGGILQLLSRCTFDSRARSAKASGLFGGQQRAMNYQEVVVRVLPTNFQQRETLVVELAADTVNVLILGRRRTNTKDARDLMLTAVWISSSLGQPLRIEGECKENAAVQAMIAASR